MKRLLTHLPFAAGLAVVAWVGAGTWPGNPLALALVVLIGAGFVVGALELQRFRHDTRALALAVARTDAAPSELPAWLATLPPGLQPAVRLRLEGERVALPGPALAPYLTGLLVLLGMLGTFLGLVVTIQGTGLALAQAADVDAIRASLAAPVLGLGLAFGTSVAGVAASAMLGLMSALARRERQRAVLQLDACLATRLHPFTRAHQRERSLQLHEQSLQLMQAQAQALPALVDRLAALATQLTDQDQARNQRLLASQTMFQDEARQAYTGLAASVDRTLQGSLAEGARLAGAAIEPAVQSTLAGLARESATLRETLADAVQRQLSGMNERLDAADAALAGRWQAALDAQQRQAEATAQTLQAGLGRFAQTFQQRSAALLDDVAARLERSATAWDAEATARERERMAAFQDGLATLTATLQREARLSDAATFEHQQQICRTLESTAQAITAQAQAQARAMLAEVAQLMQAAAEAPRAAAEAMVELRQALSDSLVRDNAALAERNRLLATLDGLLDAVQHAGGEQRAAIDALVDATTGLLDRAGTRFAQTVDAEAHTLHAVAAQVTGSAAEMASLGEGFGVAVQQFGRASEQLAAQLQGVEAALGRSMARSDEQLAYYVAQAREIVDLTLGSHQQIVDDLQRLAPLGAGAADRTPAEVGAA
jgi:Domain of unknown function (DUF802)